MPMKIPGLIAVLMALVAVTAPVAAEELISLDDLLHGEAFTKVGFSPSGDRIVFSRSVAIAERPTGGFGDDPSIVRERIFLAGRRGGSPTEVLCPGEAHCSLARMRAWSPDGGRLMLLKASNGHFNLAFRSAATGEVTTLPGRPDSTFPVFDWAGDKVVYAVLAEERRQRGSNLQMLARLDEIWRAVWAGEEGLATVSSANPVFEATGPRTGVLMMADLESGDAVKVAEGDFATVLASPGGEFFAALRRDERLASSLSWRGRRGELWIYRIEAGGPELVRRFAELDVAVRSLAWNGSGDRLLVGGKAPEEDKSQARLYAIDARSGEVRTIGLPEGQILNSPDVAAGTGLLPIKWIGAQPAAILGRKGVAAPEAPELGTHLDYGETENLRFDLHVFANGKPETLTGFSRQSVREFLVPEGEDFALVVTDSALWRVTPGSSPRQLSPDTGPPIVGFATDNRYPEPKLESAWFASGDGERVALYTVGERGALQRRVLDLRTGQLGPAQERQGLLAASPDLRTTVSETREGWVTRLVLGEPDGSERQLMTVNPDLSDRAVAPAERFTYTSGDQELTGWIVTPPGADKQRPLPAVVSVYGGAVFGKEPPTFVRPTTRLPQFSGQLLAAEGFAVVYPSTPLEAGAATDVMAALAQHAVAAVDALAAEGVIDPQRVGVMGQSFGGYSTAAILAKRSDRFAAGVSMAGVYDWIYAYGVPSQAQLLTPQGRDNVVELKMVEHGQIQLESPFWINSEAYIRNSPIFHVDRLDSPLLMLHGDLDLGVTGLAGAVRMYNALVRAGKEPSLVRYWGEGHVAHSAWAIRDQWSRITEWFGAYLLDGPSSTAGRFAPDSDSKGSPVTAQVGGASGKPE